MEMLEASQQQNTLTTVKRSPGSQPYRPWSLQLALSSVLEGGLGEPVAPSAGGRGASGQLDRGLAVGEEEVQPDFLGCSCCMPPLALMDGTMTAY